MLGDGELSAEEIVRLNREYTLFSWSIQNLANPVPVSHGEGVYFWDVNGNRYLDFSSQLMNVNIGHGNKKVIRAIQEQAGKLAFVQPAFATDVRGIAGKKIAEVTGLKKTFFTLGGAEAVENAMKIARLYTGRQKIIARYRAYHGATFATGTAGGDPRGIPNEPGVPWVRHVHDPYRYRCLFCRDLPECNLMCEMHIEETIKLEGPQTVAAVLLEGVNGTSGIIYPPRNREYWQRLRQFCDEHGILIIADEVMSGWGRTGKWFGFEHGGIQPDIIATAKGLTCGYVPLGAAIVSEQIADHFEDKMLYAGLTYSSHPVSCAAASACIDVYKDENLIENTVAMEPVMEREMKGLMERHPSVGEYRGLGLFYVIEVVKNRETREPMTPQSGLLNEPMAKLAGYLKQRGMSTFVRWNWIFAVPPLCITEEQIKEGMQIIDEALEITDDYYQGE